MSNANGPLPETHILWSATPTPFTETMDVDTVAIRRMVEHHCRLGVEGLFLAGTCGEGPWLTSGQQRVLIRETVACAEGRLAVAAQVTDNSAERILENMALVQEEGAEIAVIAPPRFAMNATAENLTALYVEAIRRSPLPVGIYDRGAADNVRVPLAAIESIYDQENVVLVKDSSRDAERMQAALRARQKRPALRLLNGDEFDCVRYLKAGYDGLLLGGGIFNGRLARRLIEAVEQGDIERAEHLQQRMKRLMYDVYGGENVECWLAGLKHLLVEMGIFRTTNGYARFPLTPACRQAIAQAMEREKDVLHPADDTDP